jgi:hypothetical protein
MKQLADKMRTAADVLEEVSDLYGYQYPQHANWSASELNREAEHVEHAPAYLREVKKP